MKTDSTKATGFKVIIVGGGVAGLTLANCFERAGIHYVLLEAHSGFAPQVGSSTSIVPNGGRILDQLGVYDELKAYSAWPAGDISWKYDGELVSDIRNTAPYLVSRFGYAWIFLQRQILLRTLHKKLEQKSALFTDHRVTKVDHSEKGVVVHCNNGKSHSGDLVIAADGVHSIVREEMRRHGEIEIPKLMEMDRKSLSAEFLCLFGIAEQHPEFLPGFVHRVFDEGFSFMVIGGTNATYFFVYKKLDKRIYPPNIPRFTKAETESFAQSFKNHTVGGTSGKIKFSEIWDLRTVSNLVATEEAQNSTWHWGRFVCVGDSIHKMTPNAGSGAVAAIESAAALTNSLHKLLGSSKGEKVELVALKASLKEYHDAREARAKNTVKMSNDYTRIEALDSWKYKLMAFYFIPNSFDFGFDTWSSTVVGAVKLDFLPPPKSTIGITMPYSTKRGFGTGDSFWKRLIFALPLLVIFYWARKIIGVATGRMSDNLGLVLETGWIEDMSGRVSVRMVYTGYKGFDDFLRGYVTRFTPSMAGLGHETGTPTLYAPQRLQIISFLTDLLSINAIWMIESCRRGNYFTITTSGPIIFGIACQLLGLGVAAPIYFFIHYLSLPPSRYHALDNRLVRTPYAKTLLPALIIGQLIPAILSYYPSFDLSTLQLFNGIWQFFPLWTVILHGIFARCLNDTTETDKINKITADLLYLRLTYAFVTCNSAVAYLYALAKSTVPFSHLFFRNLLDPWSNVGSLAEGVAVILRYDKLFAFGAATVWILLQFSDLKREGRMNADWVRIVGSIVLATVAFGPGAATTGMWWWREEVLARNEFLNDE